MTKKDGDRLRLMHQELSDMQANYEPGSRTANDINKVRDAIRATLYAREFKVQVKYA